MGPRAVGQAGHARVHQFVIEEIKAAGVPYCEQHFTVTAPVDHLGDPVHGGKLVLQGESFQLMALWPNLVCPSAAPARGITAPLVDGGAGDLASLDGKVIDGRIVLLDFNSGKNWENAAKLGAKAVLFRFPSNTSSYESSRKFFLVPLDMPRFLLSAEDSQRLDALLKASAQPPMVTVTGGATWDNVDAANILALVRPNPPQASDDEKTKQAKLAAADNLLIIQCYLDSMCIAPGARHGADSSLQLLAGLELLKSMANDPASRPACSVLFVFADAHHYALQGAREFGFLFSQGRGDMDQAIAALTRNRNQLKAVAEALSNADGHLKHGDPLSPAGSAIIADRITSLASQKRQQTARALQLAQGEPGGAASSPQDPTRLTYLRQLRNWYSALDAAATVTARLDLVLRGPPVPPPNCLAEYADLLLNRDRLGALLSEYLEDAQRDLAAAEDRVQIAEKFIGRRSPRARIVALALEIAPGANQFSWQGPTGFGPDGDGGRNVFPAMFNRDLPVTEKMATELKLAQPAPLEDAFSIEAIETLGNQRAPSVSESNGLYPCGITSYGLASINVGRSLVDTPLDTPASIDFDKAADSLRFLSAYVPYLAKDIGLISPAQKISASTVQLSGRVVKADILAGFFPNQPVAGSLVYLPMHFMSTDPNREHARTNVGVRFAAVVKVHRRGGFTIRNLVDRQSRGTKRDIQLFAFHLDDDQRIDYALDRSSQGTELLSNNVRRNTFDERVDIVVAPARGCTIFDLIDPRTLTPLTDPRILDAVTMSRPDTFSSYFARQNNEDDGGPWLENCGTLFVPPHSRFIATIQDTLGTPRAIYLNSREGKAKDHPGYPVDQFPILTNSALRVAEDFCATNHERLGLLRPFGIKDRVAEDLDRESLASLHLAQNAAADQRYSTASREATHAWGVALRAYPKVRDLGKDAVIASVFFLALVLPFAFFMERLTIRARNPNHRVLGTLAFFLAMFVLMYFVHPAFSISLSPMIVLLAFIMLVLMAVVSSIIYRKFVTVIRAYRNQVEGVHGADLKRFSAAGVALSLSLSTMARRKVRTLLTASTLTMLAFAIVTFSSINSAITHVQTPIANVTPSYTGLLFHAPRWSDVPTSVYDSFRDEFASGNQGGTVVLPRVWKLRSQDPWAQGIAGNSIMKIVKRPHAELTPANRRIDNPPLAEIGGIVGLTSDEALVFPPQQMLLRGHWLTAGRTDEAIVTPNVQELLGIADVDLDTSAADVTVLDQTFRIVGILNVENANRWTDLDGDPFTPVDYAAAGVRGDQAADIANLGAVDPNARLPHLAFGKDATHDNGDMMIVPAIRAWQMQGATKSVAVRFDPALVPDPAVPLNRVMQRLRVPVYAGLTRPDGSRTSVLYESTDAAGFSGFGRLIVPIILAIFMIVNTLLGTVEERKDEIAMLNSVGLAPAHVGMLFLVEALVYGVIGVVVGYMAGLILAKVLLANVALATSLGVANMSLNYSSGSTMISCVLVLMIVIASAWYPARQARRLATPGTLVDFALPPSDDDTLSIEIPFTLTGGNALGILGFLDEYLASHRESTSPDFRIIRRGMLETNSSDRAPELILEADAFLAPYDLGVSETVRVCVRATGQPNVFRVRFAITRLGGDMNSFRRSTQRFLNLLRQQFLIWRTLSVEERQKYVHRATTLRTSSMAQAANSSLDGAIA